MVDAKTLIQNQFSKNPEKYRDEKLFAAGGDLAAMIQSVTLTGNEKVLDIGTGAGHTALTFSPFVGQCVGIDITEEMVQVATDYAKERRAQNVSFQQGDAENLPFQDSAFDIITCRFAAHHFPNVQNALQEISRVLKIGGHFLLVDHYAPEDLALDRFVNTLNKMRDPSQVRETSLSEWQAMFAENSLIYEEIAAWDLPIDFAGWIERAGTPADVQQKIVTVLQNASPLCQETFQIALDEQQYPDSFCLKAALLHGIKET
jgi:ubiquinone/menaquinone biosynthesis C-methylase UbiE